jgi:hypothetical protein
MGAIHEECPDILSDSLKPATGKMRSFILSVKTIAPKNVIYHKTLTGRACSYINMKPIPLTAQRPNERTVRSQIKIPLMG